MSESQDEPMGRKSDARKPKSFARTMDDWALLVETMSTDDRDTAPGSPEAFVLFLDAKSRLEALWARNGATGPTENALGFADVEAIPGEKSLIALCFSRMVRCQANGPDYASPEWMGRRWFNDGGIVRGVPA